MEKSIKTWEYDSRVFYEDPETGETKEGVYRRPAPKLDPAKPDSPRLYVHPVARLYELLPHEFGPVMWRQLHDRPGQTSGDLSRENEWIGEFAAAIPCPTCQRHFQQYLDWKAPDLHSVEHYFAWTWDCHNWVNKLLGKPHVPWNPAWGPQPL